MRKISITLLLLIISWSVYAQPCNDGWEYRLPIYINNSGSSLNNHQISITLDMQTLVSSGKMNAFGNDIRIKDVVGNNLPFWIEEGTENTTNTTVWVKVNNIAAVSDSIYLFYGNNTALNTSNGTSTFELFDSFNGNQLNAGLWSTCGSGLPSVVSGSVSLSSALGNYYIKSNSTFQNSIIAETKVNSISHSKAYLGLVNSSNVGWSMVYETSGPNTLMKMNSVSNNGASCVNLNNQTSSVNAITAGNISGIWSFTWENDDSLRLKWPSGNEHRVDVLNTGIFSQGKQVVFGVNSPSGGANLSWVRARKYTVVQPSTLVDFTKETKLITNLSILSTGPYCEGDTLKLIAPTYIGAAYLWSNATTGYVSTLQSPDILNSSNSNSGTYKLSVSNVGGCSPVSDSIEVMVFSTSSKGSSIGGIAVCESNNSGLVKINNVVGNILNWESSYTGGEPWLSINNTTDSLAYNMLSATNYYRARIKNGVCPEVISDSIQITVFGVSNGGNLLGSKSVCEANEIDSLVLNNQIGTIINWESSIDNGNSWNVVTNASNVQSYQNLTTPTTYRVKVKNGECLEVYSSEGIVIVLKKPDVGFYTDTVCLGQNTHFNDTTLSNAIGTNIYTWDFDNGNGCIVQNPIHEFINAIPYNVKYTVTNSN